MCLGPVCPRVPPSEVGRLVRKAASARLRKAARPCCLEDVCRESEVTLARRHRWVYEGYQSKNFGTRAYQAARDTILRVVAQRIEPGGGGRLGTEAGADDLAND